MQFVLLEAIREGVTPLERTVTFGGVVSGLFGLVDSYDMKHYAAVEKALRRAWRGLEEAELIEEPDEYNGKNGWRQVSEKEKSIRTDVDLNAAKARGWLTAEVLHPELVRVTLTTF